MKLVYFNGRGLAETSRLLLALTETQYEDFRYNLNVIDWKTYNFVREEFDKDKADGKLLHSMNKLPYLEVDGHKICQSKTIERFIARKNGMMGTNYLEEARIDSICECIRDFKDAYQKVRKVEGTNKEEAIKEWFEVTLPEKLLLLENIVDNKFSVGHQLSLSDVVIFSFITQFFDNTEGAYNSTKETVNIRSVVDNIAADQRIKDWLQNRPQTPF